MIKIYLMITWMFCIYSCRPAHPSEKVSPAEGLQTRLLQGWNTWNNPSVLYYVYMPDGLALQLVYRNKQGGPYWLHDSYITDTNSTFPERITPLAHAYDGSYTDLVVEWSGMKARVTTATLGDDIVILCTPVGKQQKQHILAIEAGYLWNKPGSVVRKKGYIRATGVSGKINVYTTAAETDYKIPLNTPYFSFHSDQEAAVSSGKRRSMVEIKNIISQQQEAHALRMARYGESAEVYNAIQSVIAWNMIYDAFNNRGFSSVSRVWNEAWGGYILFDWDTYFIALMAALDNKNLAYANAIAITDAITDHGFIPNVKSTFATSNDRSQPPVGSLICRMIYDRYGEKWFLEAVYPNLLSWNRWWPQYRDNKGFLSWGSDPHPQGMDPHTRQAALFESGLDNSPLFDEAVFDENKNMLDQASVGLMGMYVADCNNLAEIADILGRADDVQELRKRSRQYGDKLQELWDEESGIYRDKDLRTGKFSSHLSPTNFYPLLGKIPDQHQAERMIKEHLMNAHEFCGTWMIPSIARDDPAFADNSYWRGRIWAPMNFLVYMGLTQYDLPDARRMLAGKSKALLLKSWLDEKRIFENYNAVTGAGNDVPNSDSFYAWGGLLGFIALMEEGYWTNLQAKNTNK
jgi:putative isomerase